MTKAFFEAFPGVMPEDEDIRGILRHTSVTRLTMNSGKTLLKVYIDADRLIPKKDVAKLEAVMDEQIAEPLGMKTRIIEKFHLSEQYSAKYLMKVYRSSILYELKGYQKCLYTLFRSSECVFSDEETCVLYIEDSIVARQYEDELKRVLDKIFTERCGLNLKLTIAYKKASVAEKTRAFRQMQVDEKVAVGAGSIFAGADALQKEKRQAEEEKEKEKNTEKAAPVSGSRPVKNAGRRGSVKGNAGRGKGAGSGEESRAQALSWSDNPDVIYGKDFDDDTVEMKTILGAIGDVTVRGQISAVDVREIHTKKGRDLNLVIISMTDFTDTMNVKLFLDPSLRGELTAALKPGSFVRVKGMASQDMYDSDIVISNIHGIKKTADFRVRRMDTWPEKRVELHCHTKMSAMDAVSDVKTIVKTAASWGHKAIAVTDHGVVQALPDAWHAVPPDSDFKVIYGCEAYLVDDQMETAVNSKGQELSGRFVVFDIETTGFSPVENRIIEIGAVKVENGKITDRFSEFVNPEVPIPFRIEQLTSISDAMVMKAETIEKILPRFLAFCEGAVLVAHNAAFDVSFIEENCDRLGFAHDFTSVDTVALARVLLPGISKYKLDNVAKALNVSLGHHHRAVDDAACTADIFLRFIRMLGALKIKNLDEMNAWCRADDSRIRKMPTYHVILLA